MLNQVLDILHACGLLGDGSTLVAGVSGGPDSMCLLDLLVKAGLKPIVAHLDHGLRPGSGEDAKFVHRRSEQYGLAHLEQRVNAAEYASEQRLSLEAAARELRYRFLFECAGRHGARAVLVAHNADDQAETILLHILRGSATAGLRGMQACTLPNAWSERVALVRPLLGIERQAIHAYMQENRLDYQVDESNQDERFTRNRIRHALIPLMSSFNPNIIAALGRMGELVGQDYEIIQTVLAQAWQKVFVRSGDGYLGLDWKLLLAESRPVQRHIFHAGLSRILSDMGAIDHAALERACDFMAQPTESGEMDLAAGVRILVEDDLLWLALYECELPADFWPQVNVPEAQGLPVPGGLSLRGSWRLECDLIRGDALSRSAGEKGDRNVAWLDRDRLPSALHVRTRRPGDRVEPLGMSGAGMKLSDYMINEKIPRRARDGWPLVIHDGEIVWVPGHTIGDRFKIGEGTQRAVRIELKHTT